MRFCNAIRPLLTIGLCLLFWGCSGAPNPLAQGLTAALQEQLQELAVHEIISSETFTAETFEAVQREHIATMSKGMEVAALEHLPTRVKENTELHMSQSLELEPDSVEIEWDQMGPENIRARVTLIGNRTYKTREYSKTVRTRYHLPWIITVEKKTPVFRHSGVRLKNLPPVTP